MPENSRPLTTGGSTALIAALALFLLPGGIVSAAPVPGGGSPGQQASTISTGTVPHVGSLSEEVAVLMVENAGFIPRTREGGIDCTHSYVQSQHPLPGTVALLGSIVTLTINRQPGPGEECP